MILQPGCIQNAGALKGGERLTMGPMLRALRVYQYPKNFLLFAALIFGQELFDGVKLLTSMAAFAAFCAASSAVYIFNDLRDLERDRMHPDKRTRPFVSGALRVRTGWAMLTALTAAGLLIAALINPAFLLAVLAYFALNLFYSLFAKNVVLLDVICVASGFVIRAVAGALAISVAFSNALVICTFFLALFLVLGKRLRELEDLGELSGTSRSVLDLYSKPLLEALILIMAAATLLVYVMYTMSPEVIERFETDKLYLTLPFVIYGLFRYLFLVHNAKGGGDPSKTLLTDGPLLAAVVLWGLASIAILYGFGGPPTPTMN